MKWTSDMATISGTHAAGGFEQGVSKVLAAALDLIEKNPKATDEEIEDLMARTTGDTATGWLQVARDNLDMIRKYGFDQYADFMRMRRKSEYTGENGPESEEYRKAREAKEADEIPGQIQTLREYIGKLQAEIKALKGEK